MRLFFLQPVWLSFCAGALVAAITTYSMLGLSGESDLCEQPPAEQLSSIATDSTPPHAPTSDDLAAALATFERTLLAKIDRHIQLALQKALTDDKQASGANSQADQVATNTSATENHEVLTAEQQLAYDTLIAKVDNFNAYNLSWQQLANSPEMRQLPSDRVYRIMDRIAQKLDKGEIDSEQFFAPAP